MLVHVIVKFVSSSCIMNGCMMNLLTFYGVYIPNPNPLANPNLLMNVYYCLAATPYEYTHNVFLG